MDWSALRRIVTGNGADGRSAILFDGGPANLLAVNEAGLAEIWAAALTSDGLLDGEDRLAAQDVRLEPGKNAVKARWFTVAPEDKTTSAEEIEQTAAGVFTAIGAAHARVDPSRHPMMHRTDTLDVIVMVKGEVDMLLDDGEARSLRPGDVVIQRATNHAWVNRGTETALLVAVLIKAGQE